MSEPKQVLTFPAELYHAMIAHALAELPNECCGMFGGNALRAASLFPLRNVAEEPARRYEAHPNELIAVDRDLRALKQHVVGIYHSHPRAAAVPSPTDLSRNYYGNTPHIIVSLVGSVPEVRVWRLDPDSYTELAWRIDPSP